jgi:aspartyl-tRNA(Asn)/glutamyl-tRNA(Gln) amidotransferase subunit C
MPLSREEVQHLALLVRLGLSEEEVETFRHQLSQVLDHFRILQELDTTDVPPTAHVLPLTNVMRDDVPATSLPVEEVLANAPQREGDYFRVRAVLEE